MFPPLITNCRTPCQMANLQNFYADGVGKVFRVPKFPAQKML